MLPCLPHIDSISDKCKLAIYLAFSEIYVSILAYFRRPFPSRQGFSAYRFPGLAAHIPFLVAFAALGILLCGGANSLLRPLIIVWIVAGLFLGRDIAIFCHYAPPLLLVIWAAMYTIVAQSGRLGAFGRRHPGAGVLLSALVLALQIWIARRTTRTEG